MEEFKVIENYLMIRLPDEIDHHKSVDISAKADRYILSKKVGNVVFDFERTTFMDSSGIGIILGRYKKISCFGGKVYAVNADNRIRRILLMSGLQNIVEIMDCTGNYLDQGAIHQKERKEHGCNNDRDSRKKRYEYDHKRDAD